MNWDAIGAIGEIIGAVAVLVTLVYLAKQTHQTNQLSRIDAVNHVLARFDQTNLLIASDAETRRVLLKRGPLTEEEDEHLYAFIDTLCNSYAAVEEAHRAKLVDDGVYSAAARDLEVSIQRWPHAKDKFRLWLERYPEFRSASIFEALR